MLTSYTNGKKGEPKKRQSGRGGKRDVGKEGRRRVGQTEKRKEEGRERWKASSIQLYFPSGLLAPSRPHL